MNETSKQWTPRWVDFQCHVDLCKDHVALIAECDRERVMTLAVTTTPKAWPRNRELAAKSAHVRIALGLHPQLVAERENELPIFERYLSDARYVGEIGLDAGPRFYRRVFERILRACAEQGGKILTVHSVRGRQGIGSH
ncbi:TatD family hydrolase [Mesorhizobium sp.]|uniref:TatD family hydrolase n=1 Tax=Mesorhizobium sp. TaxID=1871066 RepID=UPI0025EF9C46|nr:TatD family hydrolase [Mesorhizobium sp.]